MWICIFMQHVSLFLELIFGPSFSVVVKTNILSRRTKLSMTTSSRNFIQWKATSFFLIIYLWQFLQDRLLLRLSPRAPVLSITSPIRKFRQTIANISIPWHSVSLPLARDFLPLKIDTCGHLNAAFGRRGGSARDENNFLPSRFRLSNINRSFLRAPASFSEIDAK